MANIKDILLKVERLKEGHSESHTPGEWKETFDKKRAESKLSEALPSPIRKELGRLQDKGLGQNQPELPKADIVGKS